MIINNIFVFICFLIIIVISICKCEEVININSNIIKRSVNVLGDYEYNYAVADIDIGQELYYYDYASCPNFECPSSITDSELDCSCDYTIRSECPKLLDPICNKTCSNDEAKFQCNGDWIVLEEFDREYTYTIDKKTQFRFKANGTICSGIHFRVNSIDGYGHSSIGSNLILLSRRTTEFDSYSKNVQFNVCPTDNVESNIGTKDSFTTDTYFIEFEPIGSSYTFSFILRSIEIKEKGDPSIQSCQPILSTHKCITINEPYLFYYTMGTQFLTAQITQAGYYYFNIPNVDSLSVINEYYISDSDNIKLPYIDNSTYSLFNEREIKMMLYLEPINSTHPLTLYIRVVAKVPSSFTFSIQNFGQRYQYALSSMPSAQSGYLELKSSSKLVSSQNQTVYYSSRSSQFESNETKFSILYPQKELNVLYPISNIFDYSYTIRNMLTEYNSFKPNSYQISFLLDQSLDSIYQKFESFDTIKNSKLIIYRDLFNKDGKPIKINVNFTEGEFKFECKEENYYNISKQLDSVISSLIKTSDEISTNNFRYAIDILLNGYDWLGCKSKIDQFFKSGIVEESKFLTNCQYEIGSALYASNPCCNSSYSYYECCNPSLALVNSTKNVALDLDLVQSQCKSIDCTVSVLLEYNKTLSTIDECSVKDFDLDKIGYSAASVVRKCKDIIVAPFCSSDSDCIHYGSKKCNLYSRVCEVDFQVVDKEYIKCVLSNLEIGTRYYLINGTSFNDTTIDTLYNQHLIQDCIGGTSIMDRSTYSYGPLLPSNYSPTVNACLDSTCPIINNAYYDSFLNPEFVLQSRENCSFFGYCPLSIDNCLSTSDCHIKCNSLQPFCGYCSGGQDSRRCFIGDGLDQATCQSQSQYLCILPNGQVLTNITSEQDCRENYGKCTQSCGKKCTTLFNQDSGCYLLSANSQYFCQQINGTQWIGYCYLPNVDKEECESMGYLWEECSSKKVGSCMGTASVNTKNLCTLIDNECVSEQQCVESSGSCSDEYYFQLASFTSSPLGIGRCVRHREVINDIFTCNYFAFRDNPFGCQRIDPIYFNEQECLENEGFKWWIQAQSKSECLESNLCKTLQPNVLPYNFKYNEMNEQQCLNCNDSFNEWTTPFEWTDGIWLPALFVKSQWIVPPLDFYVPTQFNYTFSYELFYSSIKRALGNQNSEFYRSESLCKLERVRKSLNSLVCSCNSDSSIESCFESSIPVIGLTKVCPLLKSKFTFEIGLLEFSNQSVTDTCQTFTISQITKEIYTSVVPDSLASNFVAYKKPDNYAVLNSRGATIGTLVSDGIMIESQNGIKDVVICFKESSLIKFNLEKFPILDLAIQLDSDTLPTPLGLVSQRITDAITGDGYYCTNISSIASGSPIYFQINRFRDGWENTKKELFDRDTKGLMYTLAIIFLLVSIFGFYQVSIIVYLYIKRVILHFQLIQILTITITLFLTIRMIYFFLLVEGKLSNNQVLDYILVVLPTFLYFTSFMLVLAIFIAVVYLVLKNNRNTSTLLKRLYLIVFLINLLLYMFFVSIIFVYQYTQFEPNNDCGSRITTPPENSVPQKAVSISYAVVQAVLSLAIGVSFVYLGLSLYKTLSFKKIKTLTNSNHQNKIFIISITSSIGFILHSIFVLVLVSNINSIVFSFIGLILTEIIPAISILYCFKPKLNQKEESQQKQKSSNSNKISSATKTNSFDE